MFPVSMTKTIGSYSGGYKTNPIFVAQEIGERQYRNWARGARTNGRKWRRERTESIAIASWACIITYFSRIEVIIAIFRSKDIVSNPRAENRKRR